MNTISLKDIFHSTTPGTYQLYLYINRWLNETNTKFEFYWEDTGTFLPSHITLEEDSAVAFRLMFLDLGK